MLNAFADLLEAQEKAKPVAYAEFADNGCVRMWSRGYEERSPGTRMVPLYTHTAPSDAERLAEALERTARHRAAADRIDPDQWRSVLYSWEDRALAAHSAQAQPPAASVTDAMVIFEVVSGVEGPCLTISRKADGKPRHAYRLAGPKPWGGGNTTHSFKVHTRELREQIDAIEAALAAQENSNGV
jgi:hypothetical protein